MNVKENLKFLKENVKFGIYQWADKSGQNIIKTSEVCPNLCVCCYDLYRFIRFHTERFIEILDELEANCINLRVKEKVKGDREKFRPKIEVDIDRVIESLPKTSNEILIMLPSNHDIFPEMFDAKLYSEKKKKYIFFSYSDYLKELLKKGCELLIVTKPRLEVIKRLCKDLDDPVMKKKIVFRFTISSDEQYILDFFETFTPSYNERIESLIHAYNSGFRTSVSIEPYYTDPKSLINTIRPFITDGIWIGFLRAIPSTRFLLQDLEKDSEASSFFKKVRELYKKEKVMQLIRSQMDDKMIFWKDSIIKFVISSVLKYKIFKPKTISNNSKQKSN